MKTQLGAFFFVLFLNDGIQRNSQTSNVAVEHAEQLNEQLFFGRQLRQCGYTGDIQYLSFHKARFDRESTFGILRKFAQDFGGSYRADFA